MGFLGEPVRCKDSPVAPVRHQFDMAKEKPRGCPQVLTFQPWRNVTSPSAMARAMESCESSSEKKPGFKPAPITTSPTGTPIAKPAFTQAGAAKPVNLESLLTRPNPAP